MKNQAEWNKKAAALAFSFAPPIFACKKCGEPVLTGYCCTYCKDTNPSEPPERYREEKESTIDLLKL